MEGVVAGHRVIRLLGAGDRAVVYLGHTGSESVVALKVFHPATETASVELDIAVLTSAAAPGLVRLLDVAQVSDGRICLILERLPGGSLAKYLVEHPALSPGEVVTLLAPITVALGAMHTAGFSHGSVSQSTVLLDANGRAVLTGFGAVSNLGEAPRDRLRRLRVDYERWGIVMLAVFESVDRTDPHHESGAALVRRFQASINSAGASDSADQAAGTAHPGSILGTLEYDLFGWADAEPLRGFHTDDRRDAQSITVGSTVVETETGQVNGVQLRHTALQTDPVRSGVSDNSNFHDDTCTDKLGGKFDNDVDSEAYRGDEYGAELSESFSDRLPRGRFSLGNGSVHRSLSVRGTAIIRAFQQRTGSHRVFEGIIDSLVDAHPFNSAGHALRKRLHGHHRPLLVAVIGGAGILMLALTLFPVSGRAGETGTPETARTNGATQVNGTPGVADSSTLSTTTADVPADAAGSASQAAIAGDDPIAAVLALLERRAACLATTSLVCLVDVDQTGSAMLASDSYDARERQQGLSGRDVADYAGYSPSLAERSGDLAVVVLTPVPGQQKGQPASVLVVKGEDGWRLREIFDY